MNQYVLYTDSGKCYVCDANTSDVAIEKVERAAKEGVSSWFIGVKIPRNAIPIT